MGHLRETNNTGYYSWNREARRSQKAIEIKGVSTSEQRNLWWNPSMFKSKSQSQILIGTVGLFQSDFNPGCHVEVIIGIYITQVSKLGAMVGFAVKALSITPGGIWKFCVM